MDDLKIRREAIPHNAALISNTPLSQQLWFKISLDLTANCLFVKLFKTSNIRITTECQLMIHFVWPICSNCKSSTWTWSQRWQSVVKFGVLLLSIISFLFIYRISICVIIFGAWIKSFNTDNSDGEYQHVHSNIGSNIQHKNQPTRVV